MLKMTRLQTLANYSLSDHETVKPMTQSRKADHSFQSKSWAFCNVLASALRHEFYLECEQSPFLIGIAFLRSFTTIQLLFGNCLQTSDPV